MFRGPEEPVRQNRVVRTANVTIDLGGQAALRDGTEVRLSPTEYGLIAALAAQAGEVVGHRMLLQTVWGPGYGDERHYLRTFVHRLRAKLEADPKHPEVVSRLVSEVIASGCPLPWLTGTHTFASTHRTPRWSPIRTHE